MKLAFILFHYFPHGGLQRDFYRIAETCHQQGHDIHVYSMRWIGNKPDWMNLHLIKAHGWSNHTRCKDFCKNVLQLMQQEKFDQIVGFNKMLGLDIYYAADGCFANKNSLKKNPLLKFLPRYRTYLEMERAVFSPLSHCKILSISPKEKAIYQEIYHTQSERFIDLPPGISKDRIPHEQTSAIRKQYRQQFNLQDNQFALLSIGSSFRTKGIDRVIQAIAALPEDLKKQCQYFVVGKENNMQHYKKLSKKLRLAEQIHFFGARDDIPALLWMSDLLIHAARTENTGTAIVEAIVAHLPVIATANCGYAFYVNDAQAGMILAEPFKTKDLTQAINELLDKNKLEQLQQNAADYSGKNDLFGMIEQAANNITNNLSPLAHD